MGEITEETYKTSDGSVFRIETDGSVTTIREGNTDIDTLLIPNIYNIIDTHISTRNKNKGKIVVTCFPNLHCQILSNSLSELMWDMLFDSGNLKEQMELERFKNSKYYSIYADNGGGSYSLVLNTNKKTIAHVIVDLMINVFDHPKGQCLNASTEVYKYTNMGAIH